MHPRAFLMTILIVFTFYICVCGLEYYTVFARRFIRPAIMFFQNKALSVFLLEADDYPLGDLAINDASRPSIAGFDSNDIAFGNYAFH